MKYLCLVLLLVAGCKTKPPDTSGYHFQAGACCNFVFAGHSIAVGNGPVSQLEGSFNMCFGEDSCRDVRGKECIVDIKPLAKSYGMRPDAAELALRQDV